MKLLISTLIFLFALPSFASEVNMSSKAKTEFSTFQSKNDRKKDRRKKRINKKRKKACSKWTRRSYAG